MSLPHITSRTYDSRKSERIFSLSNQPHSSWYEEIGPRVEERETSQDGDITPRREHPKVAFPHEPDVQKPPLVRGHGIVKTVEVTVE